MRRIILGAVLLSALALGAPVVSAAGGAGQGVYVVQPGDTLYSLAKKNGTTVARLAELNGVGPDFIIRVGQTLILPAETQAVEAGAGVGAGAVLPTATAAEGKRYAIVRSAAEAGGDWETDGGKMLAPAPSGVQEPVAPALTVASAPAAAPASAPEPAAPAAEERPAAAPAWIIPCTEEERLLLARLVTAEAGNETPEGQLAVAAVVVNRVRHAGFPKTVTAVIQEPGQFKAVELGRVEGLTPSAAVLALVDRALAGEDPTKGALFFYNPAKSVAMDFWRTRPVTAVIGAHNFAR